MSKPAILAIDDDPSVGQGLQRVLRGSNVEVHSVTNSAEGLSAALHLSPDLILLDMEMPGINGLGLLYEMRTHATLAHVPVVFLSGDKDQGDKIAALQTGAVDWLTKPTQPDELLAKLRSHLKLSVSNRERLAAEKERLRLVAHDLRAPLTIVQGAIELRDMGLDPQGELQASAKKRIRQMCDMIQSLSGSSSDTAEGKK